MKGTIMRVLLFSRVFNTLECRSTAKFLSGRRLLGRHRQLSLKVNSGREAGELREKSPTLDSLRTFDDDDDWASTETPQRNRATRQQKDVPKFLRRLQQLSGDAFAAFGFISSATSALLFDRKQFKRLRPTVKAFRTFLETSGIDLELSQALNTRLLQNLIILGRIQKKLLDGRDRRDLAITKTQADIPSFDEALRYMKYATAAYGASMIQAVEIGNEGRFDSHFQKMSRQSISDHVGIPHDDIIEMDLDYDAEGDVLRHFVAVDHENKRVVLAIRGTFSLSEIIVDVAGFSRQFCGGEAHSEMANMAERVWESAHQTVTDCLQRNQGYELILTGHSLGGGAACLLNILLHRTGSKLSPHIPVRCFSYAAPPVFTPLSFAPKAVQSCHNYIYHRDVVPFLSVHSIRHLFAALKAIEDQRMGFKHRLQLMLGQADPSASLCQLVRRSLESDLIPKTGAPKLEIPCTTNVWLRPTSNENSWDYKTCDSRQLNRLGILVVESLFQDHFPTRYEESLLQCHERLLP